jgi:hypothetical protein
MGLIHGIFYAAGEAFFNADTIIPIFLSYFTNSKTLIGLSSTLIGRLGGIASVFPQLFVANRMENNAHKKPLLIFAITIRALIWGILAIATYIFSKDYPHLIIFALFFTLIVHTLMGGIAVVPFYDIWGKCLPSNLRGRFFGHRQLWGGLLAIGSGFIAKIILEDEMIEFPLNFVILFFFAFIFLSVSYIALGSVREPVEDVYERRLPFRDFLKKASYIIQRNSNYRKFIAVEILSGTGAMALPFYILYLREYLGMELGMVGILLSAQMFGSVLSNILWAHLSDFAGNKKVIQTSTFIGLIIPFIALGSFLIQHSFSYIVLFILIGFFISGRTIGKDNYLLDISPSKERPKFISLTGTLLFPVSLFPLLGGFIVQYVSYHILFLTTATIMILGFILSFCLSEPRNENIV